MKRSSEYFYGCLIGGAIGDALGAPIEFFNYKKIQERYGVEGLKELIIPVDEKKAWITDDTQMTLFTAEGLMRSTTRAKQKNIERNKRDITILIFRAYLRWLYTQGLTTPNWGKKAYDGWLVDVKRLHAYREPGVTCITTLGKGIMGTEKAPINDSKGCGGIIRVAPVGLYEKEEFVFDVGSHTAAITHGHPTAYLAAGTMAAIIYYIIQGKELEEAILSALEHLKLRPNHEECLNAIERAMALAKEGEPSVEKLHTLGKGFVAEETLSIAIYAVLSYPADFEKCISLAVNHDGDSDSTGAVAGNLLGAYLGASHIPQRWIQEVELSKEIQQIAEDLLTFYEEGEKWHKKYPSW